MNFTNWQHWPARNQLGDTLPHPGVYAIRVCPEALPIGTAFECTEDIIYIGMTNSVAGLKGRLAQFDETMRTSRVTHGGADRVRLQYQNYNEFASFAYVSVCSIACNVTSNQPDDLRRMGKVAELEYQALATYAEKFGKLPKFNDKKGTKKFSKATNPRFPRGRG
jgi:hypothetical protein